MTKSCNICMICLKLNWFFYGLSRMLQFSEFVWTPCYSVWDVFNTFLLIDATDRSKISSDQKGFFIALSLYPLSFFANTPFKSKKCATQFCRETEIENNQFKDTQICIFNYFIKQSFKGYSCKSGIAIFA